MRTEISCGPEGEKLSQIPVPDLVPFPASLARPPAGGRRCRAASARHVLSRRTGVAAVPTQDNNHNGNHINVV